MKSPTYNRRGLVRFHPFVKVAVTAVASVSLLGGTASRLQAQGAVGKGAKANRSLDAQLRALLETHAVEPIDTPDADGDAVILGQTLFFDRILSGNGDVACATCHHPLLATGDGLALPLGTGTTTPGELGLFREKGPDREFVPRNAPEVFNRGSVHWRSQFWDSRIVDDQGELTTPAGEDLPDGVVTVLQAQALFPVTSRDEMRGSLSDAAAGNELAAIDDDDLPEIWNALMTRLLAYPDYVNLFANAFPETAVGDLGFEHAAIAIAAFEATAFGYDDSPFDNYLRGDNDSLTEAQKRGALLFYGSTGCVRCHSGTLLTDQEHHNLAVPQLGPGKDPATGLDFGRSAISLDDADLFRFRTPPLRNVTATGPYMHNGAFNDLEGAVRHHLQTLQSFQGYDPDSELLQAELAELVVDDRATNLFLLQDVDIRSPNLGKKAFADLMSFLEALTVPNLDERLLLTIPDSVPSGLLESGL